MRASPQWVLVNHFAQVYYSWGNMSISYRLNHDIWQTYNFIIVYVITDKSWNDGGDDIGCLEIDLYFGYLQQFIILHNT